MPLTPFQKNLLAILAANRSEESHFAGGVLLHVADDSPRYSRDFDIFHEVAREVVRASERDVASVRAAGFAVDTISRAGEWDRETTFRRAIVRGADGAVVEIDRAADSAYRFFPIERDEQLGWRLHLFDAATNKALTLAARTETRDYVDIVEVTRTYPLAAICWAACGKDPGFTPLSLLKMMRRFARIDPIEAGMDWRQSCPRDPRTNGPGLLARGAGPRPRVSAVSPRTIDDYFADAAQLTRFDPGAGVTTYFLIGP
jgi:hypothetical protein